MARTISNSDKVIDSRDVIKRIEALESERDDFFPDSEDGIPDEEDIIASTLAERRKHWAEENEDDAHELKVLLALQDEASGSPDWTHGEALIADSYFEDYARELAEDCGMVSRDTTWPNNHLDWEAASEALKQDYTEVDFDGASYWIRS